MISGINFILKSQILVKNKKKKQREVCKNATLRMVSTYVSRDGITIGSDNVTQSWPRCDHAIMAALWCHSSRPLAAVPRAVRSVTERASYWPSFTSARPSYTKVPTDVPHRDYFRISKLLSGMSCWHKCHFAKYECNRHYKPKIISEHDRADKGTKQN